MARGGSRHGTGNTPGERREKEKEEALDQVATNVISTNNKFNASPLQNAPSYFSNILSGSKQEKESAAAGLNLAEILYGQKLPEIGKDIQNIQKQFEQRSKGMDPISAGVQAQKQGAIARAQREAAQSGFRGPAAMGAVSDIERRMNREIASSLYGQSGQALDRLRSMASNMASGTTSLMYGNQAQGTPMPSAPQASGFLGTVLCTELYEQGILDKATYLKDSEYGRQILMTSPEVVIGYHFWAKPIVKLMKKSKLFTHIVKYPVLAWANHIANNKKSVFGHFCVKVGQPICGFIGKIAMLGDKNVFKVN